MARVVKIRRKVIDFKRMNERTVYLNGNYIPAEQATVSVFDRGYLFADAVYEVLVCLWDFCCLFLFCLLFLTVLLRT